MKKKVLVAFLSVILLAGSACFLACDNTSNNPNKGDGGLPPIVDISTEDPSDNPSQDSPDTSERVLSGTEAEFKGFTESKDVYTIKVSHLTETFNFSDFVRTAFGSRWDLSTDMQVKDTIPSKIVNLEKGDNKYYILVTDKNYNVKLYTVNVHRKQIYRITYEILDKTYSSSSVEEGDYVERDDSTPIRKGYVFVRWNFDFTQPIFHDTVISAIFRECTETFTVTVYTDNETDAHETYEVMYGEQVEFEKLIKRKGYALHNLIDMDSGKSLENPYFVWLDENGKTKISEQSG